MELWSFQPRLSIFCSDIYIYTCSNHTSPHVKITMFRWHTEHSAYYAILEYRDASFILVSSINREVICYQLELGK